MRKLDEIICSSILFKGQCNSVIGSFLIHSTLGPCEKSRTIDFNEQTVCLRRPVWAIPAAMCNGISVEAHIG